QLGDGTNVDKNSPIQIGIGSTWQSIAAGYSHTIALKTDGTMWACGHNYAGQLGDGTIVDKNTLTQIGIANNWQSISASNANSSAINNNGSLFTWGYNFWGQLGNGSNTNQSTPNQIGGGNTWQAVKSGAFSTLAIKTNGTLWACGNNSSGQLGDGTNINKNTFTQIGMDTNWQSITAGSEHSMAIKTDGTLWVWGGNLNSQLGDGTYTNKNTPTYLAGVGCFPLPVHLMSFYVNKCELKNACLTWESTSEGNMCCYDIESSTDGIHFARIATLPAKNDLANIYRFTDLYPSEKVYYRLKMIDIDQSYLYSEIVDIEFNNKNNIRISPNPANTIIHIDGLNGMSIIELMNMQGQTVSQIRTKANKIELSTNELNNGIYQLKVTINKQVFTEKVIIQHSFNE
ncbi:MAG TPA: T9SS type A sorting domain-containing protein, partial [Chitinophagaceae bacterium]|nr:T9SS type A sorting domain-containing protein [Chitinophagaceae bacterium]